MTNQLQILIFDFELYQSRPLATDASVILQHMAKMHALDYSAINITNITHWYFLLVWCLGVGRLVTHLANQREGSVHDKH